MLRLLQRVVADLIWLPTLAVVAFLLNVANRRTEQCRSFLLCDCQQGELRVEVDELLNDYLLHVATAAFHCLAESLLQFVVVMYIALSVSA